MKNIYYFIAISCFISIAINQERQTELMKYQTEYLEIMAEKTKSPVEVDTTYYNPFTKGKVNVVACENNIVYCKNVEGFSDYETLDNYGVHRDVLLFGITEFRENFVVWNEL